MISIAWKLSSEGICAGVHLTFTMVSIPVRHKWGKEELVCARAEMES